MILIENCSRSACHLRIAVGCVDLEIMEWLHERISHIRIPRSLDMRFKLPCMDNGKLYKRYLVDKYRSVTRSDEGTRLKDQE